MPSDLTIFAAKYLILIDAAAAGLLILYTLYYRPRTEWLRWTVTAGLILVISVILAQLAGMAYNDPRPFTMDHVRPLIAHGNDNGFPSDHALLAAAIVAVVALLDLRLCLPFVVLGFLVDWARVGAGIHHVVDVVGSSLIVAVAVLIALLVAPAIARRLETYLPESWRRDPSLVT
jgi:membrane-associated phospholipid phosphatase